jgi:hypothetical protein
MCNFNAMKAKLLIVIVLGMASIVISGCRNLDTVESRYLNYKDALDSGAIGDGGWLPVFLPTSAMDIKEYHNIDTNEVWLAFLFSAEDMKTITDFCSSSSGSEVKLARRSPANWWPQVLTEQRNRDATESIENYTYSKCVDGGFLAYVSEMNEAYYWHFGNE